MTRWTEADLDLFKSRRQRGTQPPPPLEFHLHCMIADTLVRWCTIEWRWTHLPMGEYRPPATAARLRRMGVTAGWPDFMFFHCMGRVCFLELKRKGNDQTEAQAEKAYFLSLAGHDYICTSSFETALNTLKLWGVVPSTISTGSQNTNPRDVASCAQGERAIDGNT